MRKVLILSGSLKTGGAEKMAQSIAIYGDTRRFEYHYLVFHPDPGEYEDILCSLGCIVHRFPEPKENCFIFIRKLIHLLRCHNFQAVHAHTMFNCGIVMFCAWLCRIPVRISHAHSSLSERRTIPHRIYESVMRLLILLFSTDRVACSRSAGNRLYGNRTFLLIPNGIDVHQYAYSEKARETIRTSLQLKDSFVIGHIGRMVSVKNQIYLLNLMPKLLQQKPDAVLLLLGDGEDRFMLIKRIRQLDLSGKVILAGNQADVSGYLSAMDVFVLPSLFEGMPLALLEAQANGLPCVVSDTISGESFVTNLVQPVSLNASAEDWMSAIVLSERKHPGQYCQMLQKTPFSIGCSIAAIHRLYRKKPS